MPSEAQVVLIVDDNPDQCLILRTVLEHGGYRVIVEGNGEAGVDRALHGAPAMVIMDAELPRMNGWDATAAIKAAAPSLCVVILSAHALAEHRQRAVQVGADHYRAKPMHPRDVLALVHECIGPP